MFSLKTLTAAACGLLLFGQASAAQLLNPGDKATAEIAYVLDTDEAVTTLGYYCLPARDADCPDFDSDDPGTLADGAGFTLLAGITAFGDDIYNQTSSNVFGRNVNNIGLGLGFSDQAAFAALASAWITIMAVDDAFEVAELYLRIENLSTGASRQVLATDLTFMVADAAIPVPAAGLLFAGAFGAGALRRMRRG